MKIEKYIPILIALALIAGLYFYSSYLPIVLVFIPVVLLSYLFYLILEKRPAPDPEKTLPFYLFALGFQFFHFTEEYLTGFTIEVPKLFGQAEYSLDYFLGFNMVAYFIFIMGAIIIFKKLKVLLIIPILFILAGTLLNPIVHLLTSVYVGGYFPGLYTGLIYFIIGPLLLKKFISE